MILRAAELKPMLNTLSFVCPPKAVQLLHRGSNGYVSCRSVRVAPHISAHLGRRPFFSHSVCASASNAAGDFFGLRYCFRHIHFSAFNAAITWEKRAERGEIYGKEPEGRGRKPVSSVCRSKVQALEDMGQIAFGEIHVIVGPMFAGKTTALLRRMQEEIHMGRRVVLVKSDKDTRYGLNSVVSHDGVKMPCWAAADLASFKAKLGEEAYKKLDVIGIDEAQFFKDLYSFCQSAADNDGKTVIVAGLDGDFLRKSFGSTIELIPLADSVTKLTSHCGFCGKPASFTLRKTGETQTEIIGGADVYIPVCRQHYVNGQIVVEAAKTVLEAQQLQCNIHIKTTAASE